MKKLLFLLFPILCLAQWSPPESDPIVLVKIDSARAIVPNTADTTAMVSSVTAGTALSGGGNSGAVTLNVNRAQLGSGTPSATTYLRGDSSWATPTGGSGDVIGDDVSTTDQNIVAYVSTGGKNVTELTGTQGDVLYHNGTNWANLGVGASGTFLKCNGAGANPSWATPAGGGFTTLKKTADQTINSGAGVFTDVTDLTFAVTNGVDYAFHFYVTFQSASTTTGWKCGVNCPTGTLDFWAGSPIIANGAAGVATHVERHNTVRDDMTLLTATITQAVDLSVRIEGRYKCTASGTFAVRFANELVANTQIVVQKGSWGFYF